MIGLCQNESITKIEKKQITAVTSYSKTVIFKDKPIIIGERINPTGKKMLKEALRNNDMDYIYREGVTQVDAGADILDVNVGLPEIDEPTMMVNAVEGLQSILDTPLQIDTSDALAMEKALRIYNGKPMVNSVNGKEKVMDEVFPLVKKYGGVLVCLTLDENGIPETVDGRIAIAEKIINKAKEYGIAKENLVFDPLCMTVSTNKDNAKITLECIEKLSNDLCVKTVLGVSNVSFGLPNRELLNSAFFTLAMQKGLSAGIINPKSDAMMNAYYSYCALGGLDENFEQYIANVTDTKAELKSTDVDLKTAVVKGLKVQAKDLTKQELVTKAPIEIIDGVLVPALNEVGKGFEENKIFLPSLLMSAETAGASFEVIKEYIVNSGEKTEEKGKILIATVEGDIHDIGKNIVKVLLENYGFSVIDMGKDITPEAIVNKVQTENIKLVGLSALMTTTVPAMEKTISLLKAKNPQIAVMVGGAVLTENYAKTIGADYYGKDAMAAVRIAEEFFAK
jgi:5-methyltetrahydrofolate--homocysteine methyltransferase